MLTDDTSTIYTIQDAYPDIIDDEGEFTGYDPSDEYGSQGFNTDENGCITIYPDETEFYDEHSCLSPDHQRSKGSHEESVFLQEDRKKFLRKETTVETVVLLSQRRPDTHIDIKLDLSELDITAAETKATYQEIKDYVLQKFGLKVSSLYISQVKTKCGIIERENYNKGKEGQRVPQCPKEKEDAIVDALKHFKMI